MVKNHEKVVVVLPAYNAQKTLEAIYRRIPKKEIDDILLVDDCSKDNTVQLAKKLKIKVIVHKKNMGYGANQKTCYDKALKMGADFVIMLHPDGQYDPQDLLLFIKILKSKKAGLVLGSRFLHKHHGTPFYKSISIKFLTFLFNLVVGTHLSELNTGYRGYTKRLLKRVPYHKNGQGYIFDPQFIFQTVVFGFKIAEVPVSKDYNPQASSPNLAKSIEHGLENLKLLVQYILHKINMRRADFLTR